MSYPTQPPEAMDVMLTLLRATHYIQREFQTQLAAMELPFSISGPRLRVLSVVSESGPIRMSELAAHLGIKARTVTDFVDALEKDNLLRRCPDPQDRRATLLELTSTAQQHLSPILALQANIAEQLFAPLNGPERQQLTDLLQRLTQDQDLSSACFEP